MSKHSEQFESGDYTIDERGYITFGKRQDDGNLPDVVAIPISGKTIESLAVVPVAELARLRAENARLRALIERSNLEEVDGFTADGPTLKKDGRILISKDLANQEQRITEALATAAKHARDNAWLREALAKVRELAENDTGDFKADLLHCVEIAERALADDNKKDTP